MSSFFLLTVVTNGLSLCCCILGLALTLLFSADTITFVIQIKSLIKRTKETANVHPMYRDLSPRRKLGPAIFHKTESQDRLIEELQDRLGIAKQEQEEWKSQDDWLTEGVIITARPQGEEQNGGQQVEKVESRDMCWEIPARPSVHIALCGGAD